MDIRVVVATHKLYWMPDDPMYVPVHVGAEEKASIGFVGDIPEKTSQAKTIYIEN